MWLDGLIGGVVGEDVILNSVLVGFFVLFVLVGFFGIVNVFVFELNMVYGEVGVGLEFGV